MTRHGSTDPHLVTICPLGIAVRPTPIKASAEIEATAFVCVVATTRIACVARSPRFGWSMVSAPINSTPNVGFPRGRHQASRDRSGARVFERPELSSAGRFRHLRRTPRISAAQHSSGFSHRSFWMSIGGDSAYAPRPPSFARVVLDSPSSKRFRLSVCAGYGRPHDNEGH